MILLQKLFPVKKKTESPQQIIEEKPIDLIIETESGNEEIAAAVAAIAYIRSQNTGQLGASLLYGPGPYRTLR
jgi:hypothetical protein